MRRVAPGTRMVVIPASSEVLQQALALGYIETFIAVGAMLGTPGCGPCMGNHFGVPASGEVVISSGNRNFRGRMGNPESAVYLANPAVVAASAVLGRIADPREVTGANGTQKAEGIVQNGERSGKSANQQDRQAERRDAVAGILPSAFRNLHFVGRVWKYGDDVNTDVIFPGKYTYTIKDEAEMAKHALEDLDPTFAGNVRPGDIIVGGRNWGVGSSREQAVTCLKVAGVKVIVAASFAVSSSGTRLTIACCRSSARRRLRPSSPARRSRWISTVMSCAARPASSRSSRCRRPCARSSRPAGCWRCCAAARR